ncbi:outer membrane beta-barrel protein [Bartonella sp. CB189]|uniref:outer membrane beta-barrel protein n=1 Tax=Bartonella sp. CB189 TaxID=3112254 RepID=UPI002F96AF76
MNTKRFIQASIFALISASTVQAADVMVINQPAQTVSPSATVVPDFTWTGFYFGAQAGGFSSKIDMSIIDRDTAVPLNEDLLPKLSGFIGGLYAGSNFDLGDNFLVGIDTDFMWSGRKHTKTVILDAHNDAEIENIVGRTRRSASPSPSPSKTVTVTGPATAITSKAPASGSVTAIVPAKEKEKSEGQPAAVSKLGGHSGSYPHHYGAGSSNPHAAAPHGASGSSNPHAAAPHGASGSSNPHAAAPHGAMRGAQEAKNANTKGDNSYGLEQIKSMILGLGLAPENGKKELSHTLKQNWAGATRIRIGFASDRIMPYVAGGIAYTQLQDIVSLSLEKQEGEKNSSKELADETKTMIGYTLGGGIDFAMTDNILVRAEYRYSDFGKKKFAKEKLEINYKTNDFRVGIAYKF